MTSPPPPPPRSRPYRLVTQQFQNPLDGCHGDGIGLGPGALVLGGGWGGGARGRAGAVQLGDRGPRTLQEGGGGTEPGQAQALLVHQPVDLQDPLHLHLNLPHVHHPDLLKVTRLHRREVPGGERGGGETGRERGGEGERERGRGRERERERERGKVREEETDRGMENVEVVKHLG